MCKAVMRWIRSGAGVWEGRYIRRWKWRGKVHRHSHHFNSLDTKYIARFLITITTMKSFTAISTLLLLVSSVSAQTRCDPVASAIPTCGVSPPSSIPHQHTLLSSTSIPFFPYPTSFSFSLQLSLNISNQPHRSPASHPPPTAQAAALATTLAAAPTQTLSRTQRSDVWWATVALRRRCRCRLVPVRFVLALLAQLGLEGKMCRVFICRVGWGQKYLV